MSHVFQYQAIHIQSEGTQKDAHHACKTEYTNREKLRCSLNGTIAEVKGRADYN
jgi:hypothetical protein